MMNFASKLPFLKKKFSYQDFFGVINFFGVTLDNSKNLLELYWITPKNFGVIQLHSKIFVINHQLFLGVILDNFKKFQSYPIPLRKIFNTPLIKLNYERQ